MACSRLLKSCAIPPASWPSAVNFSDCWSWFSTSRWAVMSRTIAMRPSRPPWRLRRPDRVTASAAGVSRSAVSVVSKTSMAAPRARIHRASGGPVVGDAITERPLRVADGARHEATGVVGTRGRLAGGQTDAVVAERPVELRRHRGHHVVHGQVADDRAGDLAHD